MITSPSIASSNLLYLKDEIDYVNKYFKEIHLDIEDGNAVHSISIGFKLAKAIIKEAKVAVTMHLEIIDPLKFINEIKECDVKAVFIQVDCLEDPITVLRKMKDEGIPIGINVSNLDMDRPFLAEMLSYSDYVLVNTTHHDDRAQICDMDMINYAIKLADTKQIWVDGGITDEIYSLIKGTRIYAAVMGRAVFNNKEIAKSRYT